MTYTLSRLELKTLKTFLYIKVKFCILPEKFEVWLQFIEGDQNKAQYNIYCKDVAVKDGNKTNVEEQIKYLCWHCISCFFRLFFNIQFQKSCCGSGIKANLMKLNGLKSFNDCFWHCVESVSANN